MKRSGQVALFLMGTAAVGGGAYALMPPENCDPRQTVIVAPNQTNVGCAPRGSSSSGGYRSSSGNGSSASAGQSFLGSQSASSGTGDSGAGAVVRGGFGSIAHSFAAHFSGGG